MPPSDVLDAMRSDIADIKAALLGDIKEPNTPGLLTRVDRLEKAEERRGWWVTTTVGAAITSVVGMVVSLFNK